MRIAHIVVFTCEECGCLVTDKGIEKHNSAHDWDDPNYLKERIYVQ